MKFGLIGYPIGHSLSPAYFREKFDVLGLHDFAYDLYEARSTEDIPALLRADVFGFNVTIPYKTAIIRYLDELDETAVQIGAVNTLVRTGGDSWKGYNTDSSGFSSALTAWWGIHHCLPARALVLGTGGAAKAVGYALRRLDIVSHFVSRGKGYDYTYDDLTPEIISAHLLIVNATPLGMTPYAENCPAIPYEALTPAHRLFDLVVNPSKTLFLTRGQQMGAVTKNGLDMLHLQADHAWAIWKTYGKF